MTIEIPVNNIRNEKTLDTLVDIAKDLQALSKESTGDKSFYLYELSMRIYGQIFWTKLENFFMPIK